MGRSGDMLVFMRFSLTDYLKSCVGFLYVSLSLRLVVRKFRNPGIFDG